MGATMRWRIFILLGSTLAGCASNSQQSSVAAKPASPIYNDAIAAALVFNPPAIANEFPLDMSREGRSVSAFAGFDEIITTFYYLRMDDYQQTNGKYRNDRFERQAITERVGVSYR